VAVTANIGSGLVSIKGLVGRVFSLVACGKLNQVAVVIAHPSKKGKLILKVIWRPHSHLAIEHLRLPCSGGGDKVLVEDIKNVLASSDSIFSW
jgi:hypothetical protein